MANVGEEIVGAYLRAIEHCDMIEYNIKIEGGEIDVVGIDIENKKAFFCEVATHLITGLQYVRERRPDNIEKLSRKFEKDIDYANKYFEGFEKHFMLWSPVVKVSKSETKWNQIRDIREISKNVMSKRGIEIELIINEEYQKRFDELREYSSKSTEDSPMTVIRLLQIEEILKKHVNDLKKKNIVTKNIIKG